MLGKVKDYIVDFTLISEEPLHIILGAMLDEKIISDAREAIQPILELIQEGYLECLGNEYEEHNNLTEDELIKYVKIHEPEKFEEYPSLEQGGEYFLQATDKGRQLFPDEWETLSSSNLQRESDKSVRELWRNKETGELLQKHIFERKGKPVARHPHYEEARGWD